MVRSARRPSSRVPLRCSRRSVAAQVAKMRPFTAAKLLLAAGLTCRAQDTSTCLQRASARCSPSGQGEVGVVDEAYERAYGTSVIRVTREEVLRGVPVMRPMSVLASPYVVCQGIAEDYCTSC